MLYSKQQVADGIKDFQKRMETEKEFCEELYRWATVRLLACKYAYYTLDTEIVKDATYDAIESAWYVMGRSLGHLKEDETSPCLDFDDRHPLAEEGRQLALHYHGRAPWPY